MNAGSRLLDWTLHPQVLAVSVTAKILYTILIACVLLVAGFRVVIARFLVVSLLALLTWPFRALRRSTAESQDEVT